jgi:hypothetical protein
MIDYHPDAPEGSVTELSSWSSSDIDISDAVLCRNTAPLVAVAFALILKHKPCQILGREIGQGLATLVKKLKPDTIPDLFDKLEVYQRSKTHELTLKGHESKTQAVLDKCECVRVFANKATSIESLLEDIKSMFSDKTNAVTLATDAEATAKLKARAKGEVRDLPERFTSDPAYDAPTAQETYEKAYRN